MIEYQYEIVKPITSCKVLNINHYKLNKNKYWEYNTFIKTY